MKLFEPAEISIAAEENKLLALEIEFSHKCNFQCTYCYSGNINDQKEMSLEDSRNVILQAKALGARSIVVLGGEPMIYPKIMEQVRFIRDEGLDVEIFTNGSNITESRAKELAELNVKIALKMSSFDHDKQNKFCGRNDAYDIIQQCFSNLTAAGYGKGGKYMAVSSVISKDNIDELESLWCWLREQGIEPYLEMITPRGSDFENDYLYRDIGKIEALFYRLAELDRTRFNKTWDPQPPLVGGRCLRHKYSLYVNSYGEVLPCAGISIVAGNVKEEPLSKIIQNSEVIQDLRHHREHIKSLCADCNKSEFCYGCRGIAYQMTGDYLESDPLCWRFQDRKEEIQYLPVSVDSLIPQTKPMQFVNTLICVGDRSATVETEITKDCPMVDDKGILSESAYIEIIAQACAAHNGFRTRNKKNRHDGFLLGAKNVKILGQGQVGDRLIIKLHKEAKLGDFGVILGRIYRGDKPIAEGELKVYSIVQEVSE
ncbi:MAG: radical SAM protein [Sedimentisphaerales bacterium]|nr:radical SAM protein [Sedimentisphaerales bacterium]